MRRPGIHRSQPTDPVAHPAVTCNDHGYMYRIDNTEALTFLNDPTTGVTD